MNAPTPTAEAYGLDDVAAYYAQLLAARPEWQRLADEAWEAAQRRRGHAVSPEPHHEPDPVALALTLRRPAPPPPPPPRAPRRSEAYRPCAADAQLDTARRRHCSHRLAADPDPYAVAWPREIVCLNCGQPVDVATYARTPGSALHHRRDDATENEGRAGR